jgi:hypothetical protein
MEIMERLEISWSWLGGGGDGGGVGGEDTPCLHPIFFSLSYAQSTWYKFPFALRIFSKFLLPPILRVTSSLFVFLG